MAQPTVNPYEEIGGYIPTGLAAIIAALPASPAIDDLVDAVYNYVQPIFYNVAGAVPAQLQIEIKSVARTAINSYVNNLVMGGQAGYNGNQFPFITKLIGNQMTANLPIISINDRIGNVEDLISESGLTVSEQTGLLLATTIGESACKYWAADVQTASPSWAAYYPPAPENYMDIPYYVEAAMVGALAGYGATPSGMVAPSVDFVTTKMASALIGALTVTAGKVVFSWIPRIQPASVAGSGANTGGGGMFGTINKQINTNSMKGMPSGYIPYGNNGYGGTCVVSWTDTSNGDCYYDNGGNAYWTTGKVEDSYK